jgi:prepilin-type N-terminal cleavage/methylation domain-containing protein/prepilin-type processing-associated H-X9-DG protein
MKQKYTNSPACVRNLKKGFTLIEMLVVIAIIAIIIALISPAISSARQTAINAKCMSNLKNIGAATLTYMADNKGELPCRWTTEGPYRNYFPQVVLSEYLDKYTTFHCPAMRSKELMSFTDPRDPSQTIDTFFSYGISAALYHFNWDGQYIQPLMISSIKNPSSVIYVADMHREGTDNRDPSAIQDWNLWGATWTGQTVISDRHKGKGNVLFADMHVSSHDYEEQFPGGDIYSGWFPLGQ